MIYMISASAYRHSEHIWIEAVVIPELKLGNVQRHIFGAILWNVPTTPRLKIDHKPSIVLV